MNYAVVKDGSVIALISGDAASLGTMTQGMSIVPIPDGVTVAVGNVYANGSFSTPAPQTVMSKRDFMVRFTQAEAVAVLQAASTDHVIAYAQTLMLASDNIDVADPYCVQYVNYLVSQNLLTADRGTAILAPVNA